MNLEPIVTYLQQRGVGASGSSIFRDKLPADISHAVLITSQTAVNIDPYTGVRKGRLQIVARDTTADLARAKMEQVSEVFGKGALVIGNMKFFHFSAAHEPLVFPRSVGGGHEASVNFDIAFVLV